jgi:hypothetical protein
MTLAPPHGALHDAAGPPAAEATVTAVLVLEGPAAALPQTLDALAHQTRALERLVVVDFGLDGNAVETVRAHAGLTAAVGRISYATVPAGEPVASAVRTALAQVDTVPGAPGDTTATDGADAREVEHLWVLTSDSAAAPTTLARLLDAVRRSPSVGAAGPKLLDWQAPGALVSVGVQLTRSGRVIPAPVPGEPDQGQYDRRSDVLAVPATGMLVERRLFEELGGPETAFGRFGSELDFSWRAHQSGRRVVVVPRATVRTGAPAGPDDAAPTEPATRVRREARRVALARCALWALPFLALWIALSSTVAAAALLLAKRPRSAWAELSDLGAVLTPGRVLGARWRSRGVRRVRRRDLQGLFVPSRTVLRHTGDLIHDQVTFEQVDEDGPTLEGIESGPVADEVEDLNVLGSTWASRAARNPGLLVTLLATLTTVAATRTLGGSFTSRLDHGLTGGEVVGVRATAGSLWHAWLDGWHGAGLGHGGEQGPHLVVLSALAWLISHVPFLPTPASPVGAVVTVLVTFAIPLATATAYLAARAVTRSRWPRALAALAWSTTAVATTAVASGRVGALVAVVLLPLVAAGFTRAAREVSSVTATAATVLGTAVVVAFVPALLALVLVVTAGLVLFAPARARLRGVALAVGPLLLLGPWVAALVDQPRLLLAGPGLAVWGVTQPEPWQLALLHPGGPGSYPVVVSAPLVLAGLAGMLRRGRRGLAAGGFVLTGLLGLVYAVLAPRLELGTVPAGLPHAGAPVTAWAGTGLLVLTLGLVAAALLGADGLPVRRQTGGLVALVRWPVAAAVVAGVVVGGGWTVSRGLGEELGAWRDPRPAVAVDQAESGVGNRMVLIEPDGDALAYSVLGREPSDVARSLPATADGRPDGTRLARAVGELFEQGAAPGELTPARDLSDLAVGFVGLRAEASDPRIRGLDAIAGLSRLGEHDGVLFWRVLPGGGTGSPDALAPSRARIVVGETERTVPLVGDHGRVSTDVVVSAGSTLELAEPVEWVRHARVAVDGTVLAPSGDAAAYRLPEGSGRLTVEVLPTDRWWRIGQGAALLLVVFLAVPFGTRASRRRS